MFNKRNLLLIFFGIVGFMAMFWSAADWYELMRGDRIEASFCAINSYWNCDRASMSRFGSLMGVVPVGVFGMLWFWTVIILSFGSGIFRRLLKPLLIVGMLIVVILALYLTLYLKAGCVICYGTYLCILAVGFLAWSLKHHPRVYLSPRTTFVSLLMGILVLALFAFTQSYRIENRIDEAEFQKWYASLTVESVPEISPLKKGEPNAKITFVEFSDFGCPFCEKVASILNPFVSGQADIRTIYYPFPLDSTCNPNVERQLHPHACDWAKGAVCAEEQGKFWNYHDHIFQIVREREKLPVLSDAINDFDLDQAAFNTCMAKQETSDKVRQMIEVATNINIKSTPTLFIGGRRIQGFIPLPLLRRLILEIRRANL